MEKNPNEKDVLSPEGKNEQNPKKKEVCIPDTFPVWKKTQHSRSQHPGFC